MDAKKPLPVPLGMLVCDSIIEDRRTGKKSLIGLFSTVTTPQMPCVLAHFGVFITMTEGIGEYSCRLLCSYAADDAVLGETNGNVRFNDRREVVEIALDVRGLSLARYGEYRFDFYCGGGLLISRMITVVPPPAVNP